MIYFNTLRKFLHLFESSKILFVFILFISLIANIFLGVGDPIFLKLLIDSLTKKNIKLFILYSIIIILLSTLIRLVKFVSSILTQKLKNNICEHTTLRMLETFYSIPYSIIKNKHQGYFISRIYDEPAKITELADIFINLFSSIFMFIGATFVCLFISWKIAIILSLVTPILFYLSNKYGSKITKTTKQESEAESILREDLGRGIEGYKNVKIFGLYDVLNRKIKLRLKNYLSLLYSRLKYSSTFHFTSSIFLSYAESAVLISAGIFVLSDQLTIGGLFGFMSAYWRVVNSFKELTGLVPLIAKISGQLLRLEEYKNFAEFKKEIQFHSSVELKNINFGYDSKLIFKNFNLVIKKCEKVLIVGQNGSGKSTLVNIISGFLETPNGVSKLPELNRISALLLPFGFIPGNLKDNVNYENLNKEKRLLFLKLAKQFDIDNKLENDPNSLSEGEKKKFQIIMTLLKDADYYIFDEPLANVDINGKDKVMDTIFKLTKEKSLVAIMHGEERFKNKFKKVIKL